MPRLTIRDTAGNEIINLNSRLGQILGVLNDVGPSGSVSDSRFAYGTPFLIVQMRSRPNATYSNGGLMAPYGLSQGSWSHNGAGTLLWSGFDYGGPNPGAYARNIVYGYY